MSEKILHEQFDGLIEQQRAGILAQEADSEMRQLLAIAEDLSALPAAEFKTRLRSEFGHGPLRAAVAPPRVTSQTSEIFTLFGGENPAFPASKWNFVYSVAAHALCVAMVISAGMVAVKSQEQLLQTAQYDDAGEIVLPPGSLSKGGGGGGERSKLEAANGLAPQFALRPLTPPLVVTRHENAAMIVPPTILGMATPAVDVSKLGDPMSKVLGPSSNGTGKGGGIGSGDNGGVGIGIGPGLSKGKDGGMGGGVYRIGVGVSAPRAIYSPDPEFSEEARKVKQQGVVVLYVVVGADGLVKQSRVQRSLGFGLDEKAIEAVKNWRFEPAMKDGRPVSVAISVEVNFRLF